MLSSCFSKRRERLIKALPDHSIAILTAGSIKYRQADCAYPFRVDNNFHYLTGFTEPNAIAIIAPHRAAGEYILFCDPDDATRRLWEGAHTTPEEARSLFQANEAFATDQFFAFLLPLLDDYDQCFIGCGLDALLKESPKPISFNTQSIAPTIASMRLIKDSEEIQTMQSAANISVAAHRATLQQLTVGSRERNLAAYFQYHCQCAGANGLAYESIVASGKNACTLHYTALADTCQDGDLLLIDAGCEYEYYASDITRTWPVNGRFSPAQRDIYLAVLTVQSEIIAALNNGPHLSLAAYQALTIELITAQLCALDILSGSVEENIAEKRYLPYYPHSIGHHLGLDVHDVSACPNLKNIPLTPGCVITVEPGIYLSPHETLDKKWHHIGVRIEDDVLITDKAPHILTDHLCRSIDDIEHEMQND